MEMSKLIVKTLSSVESLRTAAASWDELWLRSEVKLPVARAETVAQWLDHFAPGCTFKGLFVEQDDRLVAALPLFSTAPWPLHVWQLPGNPWSPAGQLLLDLNSDIEGVIDALVGAIAQMRGLLRLDAVVIDSSQWQAIEAGLQRRRLSYSKVPRFEIGQVKIGDDWQAYLAARSGNHRRHMRKALARARRRGVVELEIFRPADSAELKRLLKQAFEIEDRCWKGREASSVLRSPGIFEFFLKQAELLFGWDQCELLFLTFDGEPIAFEYGWTAKETYFSPKVGYDERFEDVTPGQLLRYLHYERLHANGEIAEIDYNGPLSSATAKWATSTYAVGRLLIAPDRTLSRLAIAGYRHVWRRWKEMKEALMARQKSGKDSAQSLVRQHTDEREPASTDLPLAESDVPEESVSV
jgi:CelD/BcsL family acetyltransferase involved in cellulose biosynthesis